MTLAFVCSSTRPSAERSGVQGRECDGHGDIRSVNELFIKGREQCLELTPIGLQHSALGATLGPIEVR